MTKEELVYLTLTQLTESLRIQPENFRLEDPALGTVGGNFHGPTIIWQFKITSNGVVIPDPLNNTRTIIVTYNKLGRQLQCYIYNREVNNLNHAIMADAQAAITFHDLIHPLFYRVYRQFMSLRKELIQMKYEKESLDYVKKLNSIFPATNEEDIFN